MRTRKARSLRRQSLRHARIYGHKPTLISHHGALALFGCYRCEMTMEIWDSPDCVSGPMSQATCSGINAGLIRKLLIKLISR